MVTSGGSEYGVNLQAKVSRDAAMALGVPPERIRELPTPHNTQSEIEGFVAQFFPEVKVMATSDARHLPKICYLYRCFPTLQTYFAPTNYSIKEGINCYNGVYFPSLGLIDILNEYLVEWVKGVNERRS